MYAFISALASYLKMIWVYFLYCCDNPYFLGFPRYLCSVLWPLVPWWKRLFLTLSEHFSWLGTSTAMPQNMNNDPYRVVGCVAYRYHAWYRCSAASCHCSVPQLNTLRVTQYVFPHLYVHLQVQAQSTGLHVRPFSMTPPCRQLHSVFGGAAASDDDDDRANEYQPTRKCILKQH